MRPLARTDYSRSHLSVLAVLTSTPDLTVEQYTQAFDTLRSCPNTYYTVVIVSRATDTIVGVGSIFMEQKFTRKPRPRRPHRGHRRRQEHARPQARAARHPGADGHQRSNGMLQDDIELQRREHP